MLLKNGTIGGCYQVTALYVEGKLLRRLEALGLTIGTEVKVLNRKKSGSLIFSVRGTRLAIGKKISGNIEVEKKKEDKL
jgi:ferrous iron transport protein A